MARYRCEYYIEAYPFNGARVAYSEEGLSAFKEGFWVDGDLVYTKTGDAKYWVPPHAIKYIAKDRGA